MLNNFIFVLNGPSAGGKSTVMEALIADPEANFEKLITATTRAPRTEPITEINGRDYYFISKEEFLLKKKLAAEGKHGEVIIEDTEYPKGSGTLYGIYDSEIKRIEDLGKDVLAVLDINGVRRMKKIYGDKNVISIFFYRDITVIRQALIDRGLSKDEIESRMFYAMEEMGNIALTDYVVYNIFDKDALISMVKSIIKFARFQRQDIKKEA